MLIKLRASQDALLTERAALKAAKDAVITAVEARGATDLTPEETVTVTEARAAIAELDAKIEPLAERIAELEAEEKRDASAAALRKELGDVGPAVVTKEARTYAPGAPSSFFVDSFRSTFTNDVSARERLERHSREMVVENEKRATTTGSFAGLVVPQYLVDAAALVLRQGRPVANRVNRMPLPEQGTTFQVPRGTTGATAASQSPENTNVSSTDEVWANLTITLATIAGQQDVSRQSLERGTPGIDSLVYMDLAGAYAAELDRQVLNGSGAAGQMLGILNTAGIFSGAAFGAAVTAANFYVKTAGAQNGVLSNRFLPPTAIYMAPRRWAWAISQSDSQGRPLVVPTGDGSLAHNAQGLLDGVNIGVAGTLQGLPVIVDANMPLNLGANSEDAVIVAR